MLLDKTYEFFSLPPLPDFSPHEQIENTLNNNNKNNKTRFDTLIPPTNASFSLPLLFVPGENGDKHAISEGLRFMRMARKGNWESNIEEEEIDVGIIRLDENENEASRDRIVMDDKMKAIKDFPVSDSL